MKKKVWGLCNCENKISHLLAVKKMRTYRQETNIHQRRILTVRQTYCIRLIWFLMRVMLIDSTMNQQAKPPQYDLELEGEGLREKGQLTNTILPILVFEKKKCGSSCEMSILQNLQTCQPEIGMTVDSPPKNSRFTAQANLHAERRIDCCRKCESCDVKYDWFKWGQNIKYTYYYWPNLKH